MQGQTSNILNENPTKGILNIIEMSTYYYIIGRGIDFYFFDNLYHSMIHYLESSLFYLCSFLLELLTFAIRINQTTYLEKNEKDVSFLMIKTFNFIIILSHV